MDTNVLENTLKNLLFSDGLEVFVFNVFEDTVNKYGIIEGKFTSTGSDTFTNFLESIKTKISEEYVSSFMNLVSIPKIKEAKKEGKEKLNLKYKT